MSERRARRARRPDAARSQHFLRSQALAAEIVRDSGIGPHELVLDLGAGSGRLTTELAPTARCVVAVELDPRLARRLRGRWPNVHVVCGDAASLPLPREPFRVVANIPFARTNAILRHLLDDPQVALVRADLVVEWAVAVRRALPWPSSVNGVLWGARFSTSVARRLPRSAFAPPPSVDAGVLVVERRGLSLVPPGDSARYARFVTTGFRHGLRAVATTRTLRRMQLAGVEARHLDAHQWAVLFADS